MEESIGASDHPPITTTVQHLYIFQLVMPRAARWKQSRVDWEAFAEEVDRILKENDPSPIIAVPIAKFMAALKLAGERVVDTTKPKRQNRVWVNAHVRAIIRKRNKLCKDIGTKRKERKATCQEATKATIEAKISSWNELLASSLPDQVPSKVWTIVRSLNSTPRANTPNEALICNDKNPN